MRNSIRLGRKFLLALFFVAFGYIVLHALFLPWTSFWFDIACIGCALLILAISKFAGTRSVDKVRTQVMVVSLNSLLEPTCASCAHAVGSALR